MKYGLVMEAAGSSPHTRGAPRQAKSMSFREGIIPAYAGSTIRAKAYDPNRRDHPRIRGEHVWAFRAFVLMLGSSPHTRGALHLLMASTKF